MVVEVGGVPSQFDGWPSKIGLEVTREISRSLKMLAGDLAKKSFSMDRKSDLDVGGLRTQLDNNVGGRRKPDERAR